MVTKGDTLWEQGWAASLRWNVVKLGCDDGCTTIIKFIEFKKKKKKKKRTPSQVKRVIYALKPWPSPIYFG